MLKYFNTIFNTIKFVLLDVFLIFTLLLILGLSLTLASYDSKANAPKVIFVGEELEYDVTFLSIKLGTIKILTLEDENYQNTKVYRSKVFISSNPNIPFLGLKAIFNSWMDTTLTTGRYFEGSTKIDKDFWGFQQILFNYPNNYSLQVKKYYNDEKINDTLINSKNKIVDGGTLFFLARRYSGSKNNIKVPTIMDLSVGDTYLNFTGKIESIKISSVDYPIKTYYFSGKADWVGLYGLGDKFEGWFSSDDARVPIKAKMNVYVGSVVLELKKWSRGNWAPPKFSS